MMKTENKSAVDSNARNGEELLGQRGCCFTGHRVISADDLERTRLALRRCIRIVANTGKVKDFYAGGAIGFDTVAAEVALELRDAGLPIELHLVLPCRDQAKCWSVGDRARYDSILARADSVEYVCEHYTNFCMHLRNRRMVDRSVFCIAYQEHSGGGTDYTVKYAREHSVNVINVADRNFLLDPQ